MIDTPGNWRILIDCSGQPPDSLWIGLIKFNPNYKELFLDEFYGKFPDLRSFNKKSVRVKDSQIFEVIKFLHDKRLRMVAYHWGDHQWKLHERRINELIEEINPKHKYRSDYYRFYEKLMGIIYFYAIQNIGPKSDHYNVTICHESYMDIWTLINVIHNLAKKTGWKIECTTSVRKNEHLLKMADYVAGANRKLEQHQLNSIERHTILSSPINDIDLKRIFHIWPDRIKISK